MEATVENKQTLLLLWRRPETKVVQDARFTFYAFFLIVPLLSPETIRNTVFEHQPFPGVCPLVVL